MGKLDPRLEKRFKALETENKRLHQEVNTLRNSQSTQGGNPIKSRINSMLRLTTLGGIQNKRLYMPGNKIHPLGPRFRKRRLL